ncbi:hypothetical protein COU23_01415 [Candidatus Kuenenbacteria bacterium CG10_big_fil_rev_8_21_14_0_10_36_11]|uniref:Uncharacterized protein n=1 Tax=Candidatus Kuenenbacteria bacterium CG10_big_fil_rev_8_21_14_0_10_36_11 TaxID=1974618 RepID=A0A2M6WAT8_9BACT|nr:MAG: hypothetical protein COU23_01415 [Candidatus Kuenenbacteria bacterium CG10_big_fil_rev_8_21_14_0_10_36_11]
MSKITTPLSVLALFYLMIVGLSFIALIFAVMIAYDVSNYFAHLDEYAAFKRCKGYLEKQDYGLYNSCYNQVLNEVDKK